MKIDYSKATSVDEEIVQLSSRYEFLKSELECPAWMLGNSLHFKYSIEKTTIGNKIKELERMLTSSY